MNDETKMERGPLYAGIALMCVGTILVLAKLDVLEMFAGMPLWPLVLFVAGGVVAATGEKPQSLRTGAWLAIVGCWLLVNTMELGGFRWWNSWPLMVMAAGAFQLLWPADKQERSGGLMTLMIGIWLLVTVRGWFGLGWNDSWPILLVLVGISMVVKAITHSRAAAGRRA
jgi:hypothetical protein